MSAPGAPQSRGRRSGARPTRRTRALVILGVLAAVTAIGLVALSLSVDYSGPSTFSCTGTPARCHEDHGSASSWLALIGVVDSSTTVTSPVGLWIARCCLAPVIIGWTVALTLAVIVAARDWADRLLRRRRLRRMRARARRSEVRGSAPPDQRNDQRLVD